MMKIILLVRPIPANKATRSSQRIMRLTAEKNHEEGEKKIKKIKKIKKKKERESLVFSLFAKQNAV